MIEHATRALECVGTRFRHQGRLPGVGLDCLGLVVHAVSGEAHDQRNYPAVPDSVALQSALDRLFDRLDVEWIEDAPAGSVLAFAFGSHRRVRHLAVRTDVGMVHAVRPTGVVETPLVEPWISRFYGAYRWRN